MTSSSPEPGRRAVAWTGVAVFAATFAALSPALGNGLVNWDDVANLVTNPRIRAWSLDNLRWMWTAFHIGHYHPLPWITFALDYALWRGHPFGYHLTNLALHSANAVLFFLVCLRLLGSLPAAAFAALFFSLHPLRVESVAWATERRDVLSGFFSLAAVWMYLKAARHAPRSRAWLKAAAGTYALALLSKIHAVAVAPVLVVLDVYPLGRLPADPRRWPAPGLRRVWLEKALFLAPALAAAAAGLLAQAASPALVAWSDYGLADRLRQALYGLAFYPSKTLWPLGLSPWYGDSLKASPVQAAWGAAFAASVTAAAAWRKTRPWLAAAWACYVLAILPSLGIVKSGAQLVADRYSYLSCLPWALLAGAGWGRLHARRRAVAALAALALPMLGLLTWRQCAVWHDSATLWSKACGLYPGSLFSRAKLALALDDEGRDDEALALLEGFRRDGSPEAMRYLRDLGWRLHNNRGVDLVAEGRAEEAVEHFRASLELNPDDADVRRNLATARRHLRRGRNP